MAYQKKTWTNDISELSAENFNPMEEGIFGAYPVQLIAIDSTAPSTCVTGDKYYNTTSKKIFTATGTNTWGTNGETPLEDTAYWLISENGSYAWNGTDLVSIGGGKAEVVISDEEPEEGKIWVNPEEEIPVIAGREHLVQVGTEVDEDYRVNLIKGNNLFDKDNVISGYYYVSNGISTSLNWCITQIKVKPNTKYYLSGNDYNNTTPKIVLLDNNKNIISSVGNYNEVNLITTTATTEYIGLSIANYSNDSDLDTLQLEEGNTATTYEPFIQNQIIVDNEKYTDTLNVGASLDSRSRVNVLKSNQLFNKDSVVVGYINADGSINSSDTNYKTSDFIPVKPNTTYYITASGTSRAKYFNSSKTPLNTSSYQDIDIGASAGSFTTPANCYYIRKSITNARLDDLMINEGSTALPYEPYITPSIYVDNEMLVSKNVYSTSEVVIGEWLGKPLYRKVVTISSLPNNAVVEYDIFSNTSEINECWLDNGMSYASLSNNTLKYPVNWIWTTSAFMFTGMNGKKLRIKTTENQSSNSGYFVINYTKN